MKTKEETIEEVSQKGWKSMKEYFDWILKKQKEDRKKGKMDTKKIGFAIVAIAAAILGAGCIGSGPVATPIETPEPTLEPTPEPTFRRSTQIPLPGGPDDAIFERLMSDMYIDVGGSMEVLGKHLLNGDYILANGAAKHLETLAGMYIEEFKPCVVSKDLETTKGLIIQGLKQTELAGESCQEAIITRKDSDAQKTMDQLDNAYICFEAAKGGVDD